MKHHELVTERLMDSKRVDEIRQQLANGTHHVNAAHVADKLLHFDSELGVSSVTS